MTTKRRKTRKKRSFITTTYIEPKWMKNGRRLVKTVKRQAWNVLGFIGLIATVIWLFQIAAK